jgi:hypothetical protein
MAGLEIGGGGINSKTRRINETVICNGFTFEVMRSRTQLDTSRSLDNSDAALCNKQQ